MTQARDLADLAGAAEAGNISSKNFIINGQMLHDQRGNSSASNLTSGGVFTVDRFFGQEDGTGITVSSEQSTDVPSGKNFIYSLKFSVTAAATGTDHWTRVTTRLEGNDVAAMGLNTSGNKNTLSFYVKSTRTGTHTVSLSTGYRGGSAIAGAGITLSYTINSANTWERKTITFDSYDTGGSAAWNTDNSIGVEIAFTAGQGTTAHGSSDINSALDTWEDFSSSTFIYPKSTSDNNNWGTATSDLWYITGVQLETGQQVTEFEHRSYADELARCQRYFFNFPDGNYNIHAAPYNASLSIAHFEFPVTMRTLPTMVITDGAGTTISTGTSPEGFHHVYNDLYDNYISAFTASAEL